MDSVHQMVDATISRVRLRDLAGLGRSRPARAGEAAANSPSAARAAPTPMALPSPRRVAAPQRAQLTPGTDDLMASTI